MVMGSGKNATLHQIFTPKRKKGKTWDTETDSGFLWIWTGRFKRWKHTAFTCQQPGLLTYTGRQKRGKIARGGSINLHGAVVEPSPGNTRMFTVRTQEGKKAYLRCTDPADRELCIQSIRKSGSTYGTLLDRASLLIGHKPSQSDIEKGLKSVQSSVAGSAKVAKMSSKDYDVARELQERVRKKLQEVEPYKAAFQQHLESLQSSLSSLAASLSLQGGHEKASHPNGDRNLTSSSSIEVGDDSNHRLSEASLVMQDAESLRHVDSFQSAMSELQRSPSWRDGTSNSKQGAFTEDPLSSTWQTLLLAIEDALRSEATRVVELQAENEALKAGMRNFKLRAQSNAKKLRALNTSRRMIVIPNDDSSDSEDLDLNVQTPRETSMEIPQEEVYKARRSDTLNLSSTMTLEYQQALEALEVVQRHAFALNSHTAKDMLAQLPNDEPPPDADVEYEELSEDEAKSDFLSKPSQTLPENIQNSTENVWEIVAQRDHLPQPAPLQRGFSIWSVLKSAIGKDLTRITLPATINEPLSALQRVAEDLEYRNLLDEAHESQDPSERMALVAAFIASGYSATLWRESKPFNPLLGETFEWQPGDQSCRFLCEQVSHHPPVSCWWSEGKAGWQYWGEIEMRSKFWGKSVEMMPVGTCWLQLGNELFSWNKANMSINNIILGTYWLDWYGSITVHNHTTGGKAELKFPKSSGRNLDHRGTLSCLVTDSESKRPELELRGKYTDSMAICYLDSSGSQSREREIFRINPPAEQGKLQYNMTRLAMTLNAVEPELLRQLPPTDSRLRPDQRALEDGELERATDEKLRLEEKQRQARKDRKEDGEHFFPCWFKLRSLTSQQQQGADHWLGSALVRLPDQKPPGLWEFTGSYWEAKQKMEWSQSPDIYSGGPEADEPLPSPAVTV